MRRGLGLALFLSAATLMSAACKAPPELRPDQMLRDSLGLSDRDRVHAIGLSTVAGVERPDLEEVIVRQGDHVTFGVHDRRAHSIRFERESLSVAAARWADSAGLLRPPLLAVEGTRWILDFRDAPAGRYPYVVLGGGAEGRGALVVEER
ncbi:MAG: hypothetical protein RQ745_11820 [Longimicrobiales bacterium]|nr:hypothetical protein [Longimicrobiales bacterium]